MSLLGIDVGTTGCKAVIYAVDGRRLAAGSACYRVERGAGKAELPVAEVEAAVAEAVHRAVSSAAGDPVTALCVTSMGESFVLVDEVGPVSPISILGHDPRGREELAPIVDTIGPEEFFRISGNIPTENHSLPKLLWLAKHDARALEKARKFLCWSDYISFRLGAFPSSGYSHANRALMLDLDAGQWSERIVKASGLNPDLLPMVLPEGSVVGKVSPQGEARFGVPQGAVIILGGHDQILNALGAGCVVSGTAVDGMGTFECITPVYAGHPSHADLYALGLNVEHHCLSGLFVSFIYNQSGSVAEWFLRTFAADLPDISRAYAKLEREMPPGPARPLFLPLLENSGSPHFISGASGVYEGIKFDTTRGELFKATLEGITYYFLESLRRLEGFGIRMDELVVTGGASASDAWLALKADIFNLPVVRLEVRDAGAMGAAMLAGIRTDVYRDAAEAASLYVRRAERFEPNAERARIYAERFGLYKTMYSDHADRLRNLSRLSGY